VISEALQILMRDLGDISDMLFNVPVDFSPSRNACFKEALKALDATVLQLVENRCPASNDRGDLLNTLLNAEQNAAERSLTRKQVRDEVVTMIVAGHETTAISLTWACHLLTQNPTIEQRLESELEKCLGGRMPRAEDLPNLGYVRMVLEEAMRLYPPVSIVARQAIAEAKTGGVTIPAKGVLVLSAYTTHRHPQFWDDPNSFVPERFSPERSEKRHRFAYFPFLAGRHQCLGQPLAMLEGQLILAMVAQHCRFCALPGHPNEPLPGLALRLKDGFPVTVEMKQTVSTS
jgi:cytochrome P450